MPTLRPSSPTRIVASVPEDKKVGRSLCRDRAAVVRGPEPGADAGTTTRVASGPEVGMVEASTPGGAGLDLDVHARRQAELVQGVDGLVRRLDDVDQPLVGPDLELLPRLLVDVRAPEHRVALDAGRQRDRPVDDRVGPLGG